MAVQLPTFFLKVALTFYSSYILTIHEHVVYKEGCSGDHLYLAQNIQTGWAINIVSQCTSIECRRRGGGGYSDILYILRLDLFLGVQRFEFRYFFSKMNIFWGMDRLYNLLTYAFLNYNDYIDMILNKYFQRKIVNIFLPISLNICLWCSKEPSH